MWSGEPPAPQPVPPLPFRKSSPGEHLGLAPRGPSGCAPRAVRPACHPYTQHTLPEVRYASRAATYSFIVGARFLKSRPAPPPPRLLCAPTRSPVIRPCFLPGPASATSRGRLRDPLRRAWAWRTGAAEVLPRQLRLVPLQGTRAAGVEGRILQARGGQFLGGDWPKALADRCRRLATDWARAQPATRQPQPGAIFLNPPQSALGSQVGRNCTLQNLRAVPQCASLSGTRQ